MLFCSFGTPLALQPVTQARCFSLGRASAARPRRFLLVYPSYCYN